LRLGISQRRKAVFVWMLAVPGSALVLSGCRHVAQESASSTLVIWSNPTGVEEKAFKRLCRRFEQEHPGIQIRNTGGVDAVRLIRAIVAGVPPDLSYLYGTNSVGPLAANGAIRMLDADFARSRFHEADFLPGAIAQGRYRGHLYAMPVTRDSRAFYWNRQCFREAGLAPERPPQTLEETLELAKRLTRRDASGALTRLGMQLPDYPALLFGLFDGGVWDERTGRITADRPENIVALRWLVTLSDAQGGYQQIAAFSAGFGRDDSGQNPLALGKVAMRIDGEWAAMYLEKFAPGTDYALGELPHPAAHPDLRNMAWQDGDVMVIPVGSRHPDLAWEFMRWLQQPRQQLEYASAMNNLPTIMSLRNARQFAHGSRSKRALGYVLSHIASNTHNARFFPPLPVMQLYENALRDAFDRALYHEKTPEQALAAVQARIEREMRRYAAP